MHNCQFFLISCHFPPCFSGCCCQSRDFYQVGSTLQAPIFLWLWLEWCTGGTPPLCQAWEKKNLPLGSYMGVSKNNGTPKSSILIGFSIIFTIHFGDTPIFETPISKTWILVVISFQPAWFGALMQTCRESGGWSFSVTRWQFHNFFERWSICGGHECTFRGD